MFYCASMSYVGLTGVPLDCVFLLPSAHPVHGIVHLSLSVCLFPSKIAEPLDASYSQKCFVHIPFSGGDGCALFIA